MKARGHICTERVIRTVIGVHRALSLWNQLPSCFILSLLIFINLSRVFVVHRQSSSRSCSQESRAIARKPRDAACYLSHPQPPGIVGAYRCLFSSR